MPGGAFMTVNQFTHYWGNKTWDLESEVTPAGSQIVNLASSKFLEREVNTDDFVYVITVKKGKLYLCCRLQVAEVCGVHRAARILGTTDLYPLPDQLIASGSTPVTWNMRITDSDTAKLRFVKSNGVIQPPKFKNAGVLDQQTMRSVRQITVSAAEILDTYLSAPTPIELPAVSLWVSENESDNSDETEYESFADGKKKRKYVSFYERDPRNRREAIKLHGLTCKACRFNFEATYGHHGKDYIHVHHVVPVSHFEKPKRVDPAKDLTVLCPNCHAMIHRDKKRTLSLAELRQMIADSR
jgi:hypothetical protein